MQWTDLGAKLIRAGAPIIGNALGGPIGGMIGNTIGDILANTLGVDATPEAVDEALKSTPGAELSAKLSEADAEAQARWPALAEIAKAHAEGEARSLEEMQKTIRAEILSGDPIQRYWRPVYAFQLVVECSVVWVIAISDLIWGAGKVSAFVLGTQGLLITYWGFRFAVLGVYAGGRSFEKVAGMNTLSVEKIQSSTIDQIVQAVKKRR